jgi:hypothetical protein
MLHAKSALQPRLILLQNATGIAIVQSFSFVITRKGLAI